MVEAYQEMLVILPVTDRRRLRTNFISFLLNANRRGNATSWTPNRNYVSS